MKETYYQPSIISNDGTPELPVELFSFEVFATMAEAVEWCESRGYHNYIIDEYSDNDIEGHVYYYKDTKNQDDVRQIFPERQIVSDQKKKFSYASACLNAIKTIVDDYDTYLKIQMMCGKENYIEIDGEKYYEEDFAELNSAVEKLRHFIEFV